MSGRPAGRTARGGRANVRESPDAPRTPSPHRSRTLRRDSTEGRFGPITGDMRAEAGAGGSVREDQDEVVVSGFADTTADPALGEPDARGGDVPGRPAAILEAGTLAAERVLSSPPPEAPLPPA